MRLEEIKKIFNEARNISDIKCYDCASGEEIFCDLSESVENILKKDLIYKCYGSDISICTSETAYNASKSKRKAMLKDVILFKQPEFDFKLSLLAWHKANKNML